MLIARIADGLKDKPSRSQTSHDPEQEVTNQEVTNPQDKDGTSRKEDDSITRATDSEDDDGSDADSVYVMVTDIRTNTLWPERSGPLRQRIKKAPKRVVQHMEYTRLMEDRVADLERRLRRIESQPEPVAPPPERIDRPTDSIILGLKRTSLQEYLPTRPNTEPKGQIEPVNHRRRHEFPGQLPYHLIDVVFSASHQHERLSKDQGTKLLAGPPEIAATSATVPTPESTTNDGQLMPPERIRINSVLLLNALRDITSCIVSFNKVPNREEVELQDQVILRPFKLLVIHEQDIRKEIDKLEDMHMHNGSDHKAEAPETAEGENPPPTTDSLHKIPESSAQDHSVGAEADNNGHTTADASVDEETKEISPLKSFRCLEELRVLRELLDNDLRPTFDLRKQIRDGVARSIAFQDLWHLFPIGSEIVDSSEPTGQNQIYRILDVSGGRPFLCGRNLADMAPWDSATQGRDVPKFEILSYFYNSDGKELGACQQVHTIKSYDGNKAITSLPCFPIIYSKNSRGMKPRDFFIERGRRYMELTRKTDIVHKQYNGLTLAMDNLREEVRSTSTVASH